MSLFYSSFSNYSGNMYDMPLEENEEVSFINEQEPPQCQFSQDQDLFSPRISKPSVMSDIVVVVSSSRMALISALET